MAGAEKRSLLGVILGARGLRGDVRIKTFTEQPEDIASYGPLSDEAGARRFDIVSVKPASGGVFARVAGIEDRGAAEALKGVGLYIERAALPQPEAESWYHADLVGLAAVAPNGSRLGRVKAVQNFGAGDLLEVDFAGQNGTELVPFTRAFVPEVDVAAKRIVLALPDNFFAAGETEESDA